MRKMLDKKDIEKIIDEHGGGGGEPEAYLKSASVNDNTLTLTNKDNTTVVFTPSVPVQDVTVGGASVVSEGIAVIPALFSGDYDDLINKPTIPDAVSGTNDGTNWTSLTIGSDTYGFAGGGSSLFAGGEFVGKVYLDEIPEEANNVEALYVGSINGGIGQYALNNFINAYVEQADGHLDFSETYNSGGGDAILKLPDGTVVNKVNRYYISAAGKIVYVYWYNEIAVPNMVGASSDGKCHLWVTIGNSSSDHYEVIIVNSATWNTINNASKSAFNTITQNVVLTNKFYGNDLDGASTDTVTIPAGGVYKLEISKIKQANRIAALPDWQASNSLLSYQYGTCLCQIYYVDANSERHQWSFNAWGDRADSNKVFISGYNPEPSATTLTIGDLTANNFEIVFTYLRG